MTKIITKNSGETQFGRLRRKWGGGCIKRDLKEIDFEGVNWAEEDSVAAFGIISVTRVSLWVTHEPIVALLL
jgi:hypothetical protein